MPLLQKLWQLLAIEYTPAANQVTILVTTNFPCHLFMRWTLTKIRIHDLTHLVRGEAFMTDHYYCVDCYNDNEQEEAGDTLTHTFTKPNWPVCQTRWFYFWGTRNGQPSPSESAIFEYHQLPLEFVTVTFPAVDQTCDLWRTEAPWEACRTAPLSTGGRVYLAAYQLKSYVLRYLYYISRGVLRFDTSTIPLGTTILSVTLQLCFWSLISSGGNPSVHIVRADGLGDTAENSDYGILLNMTQLITPPLLADSIPLQVLNDYIIDPSQFDIINCEAQTRIAIRTSLDRYNVTPTSSIKLWMEFVGEIDRLPGIDTHARLVITYKP